MKPPIEIPAIFTGLTTKADRSLSLRFNTAQEVDENTATTLFTYRMAQGYLLFSPNPIDEESVPQGSALMEGKSPSQRLRDVLYVYYKQLNPKTDFETFYLGQMNVITDHYKAKLK